MRACSAAGGAALVTVAALAMTPIGGAQEPVEQVSSFPMPGTAYARAETQISFRGATAESLGPISVTGSRSGGHSGSVRNHGDGQGASFLPSEPFVAGERVTVQTELAIDGARDGDYSFAVARRPTSQVKNPKLELPTLPPAAVDRFRSRRDLQAPVVRITKRAGSTAPGLIFLAPFSPKGSPRPDGPMITDNRGDLVWFRPLPRGRAVTDLKVQRLGGRPVLTWWEGRFAVGWGYGTYKVLDSSYRELPAIRARNGYRADLHDMVITERGTALLMAYDYVRRNLRRLGGRRKGIVLDNVVQEVDLRTGLVLFEWHSLGQVALDTSRSRPRGARAWDYFHINSVAEDTDGNLLVGARNTCALYKLDRHTGRIIWQLGGRGGDFRMGKGTRFCFQHDARRAGPGRISLFDNSAGPPAVRRQSRAIVLEVDEEARRAGLLHEYHHPGRLLAPSQGAAGVQPNGNMFVGWGALPVFSEFTRSGRMIFNGRLTRGKGNYRAIRAPWTGLPDRPPAIAAERARGRRVRIFASWNGATEVARWQVLAGPAPDRLERLTASPRNGFETSIGVRTRARYVAVEALDADGETLGTSAAIRPRP